MKFKKKGKEYVSIKEIKLKDGTSIGIFEGNRGANPDMDILKRAYGNDWFFVVTDWRLKESYEKYGRVYARMEVPAILKKRHFSRAISSEAIRANNGLESNSVAKTAT